MAFPITTLILAVVAEMYALASLPKAGAGSRGADISTPMESTRVMTGREKLSQKATSLAALRAPLGVSLPSPMEASVAMTPQVRPPMAVIAVISSGAKFS